MAGGQHAGETLSRVVRDSYGKLLALLTADTRDLETAEEALAAALAIAAERWPQGDLPLNPEAWLLTVARRRVLDGRRHAKVATAFALERAVEQRTEMAEAAPAPPLPDRRLELMMLCAHPAIEERIRAPLMLQVVLGLDSATIARAFLIAPATMAQRLVRAKAKIRLAGIRFEHAAPENLTDRIGAVLDAVYAAYTQGWSELSAADATAEPLTEEAIWLGTQLVALLPNDPEALGLMALMLHLEARREARRSPDGAFVPLDEQDMAAWNHLLIDQADALLYRAAEHRRAGRFQLEAAIQSAHADRRRLGEPDWRAIEQLYAELQHVTGSPVVGLNRALVVEKLAGAGAALSLMDEAARDPRLADYQPFWTARAELLARHGNVEDARAAHDRATRLATDEATREHLASRRP